MIFDQSNAHRRYAKTCNLTINDIQSVIPDADLSVLEVLKIHNSVSSKTSYGGTAPKNVLAAIKNAKNKFLKG